MYMIKFNFIYFYEILIFDVLKYYEIFMWFEKIFVLFVLDYWGLNLWFV